MTAEERQALESQVMGKLRQEMAVRRAAMAEEARRKEALLRQELDDREDMRSLAKSIAAETGTDPLELYFSMLDGKEYREFSEAYYRKQRWEESRRDKVARAKETDRRHGRNVGQEISRRKSEEEREYLRKCRAYARADPIHEIPEEIRVNMERLETYAKLLKPNDRIALYYKLMSEERQEEDPLYNGPALAMRRKAFAISHCAAAWDFDHYAETEGLEVFDLKSITYCKDRFCQLCQKKMADARYVKYKPKCDELLEEYDLYHLTLTQPNVFGAELVGEMDRVFQGFQTLSRYLSCRAKVKGTLFRSLGYYGMLRSFELTIPRTGEFHPHFHVVLVLKKGLGFPANIVNTYSYDNKTGTVTPFSALEILIQKVWYLILNRKKVTRETIAALELGYSCRCTKFEEGDYKEVFKYAIKPLQKGEGVSQTDFPVVQKALEHRKMFQGYEAFYGVKDVDLNGDELTEYDHVIGWCREKCGEPDKEKRTFGEIRGMLEDGKVIISRKICDVEVDEENENLKRKEKEDDKV